MKLRSLVIGALAWTFAASTQATIIEFTTTSLGGNSYQNDYVIENDALIDPIINFTIYFDALNYSNLGNPSNPVDWQSTVVSPSSPVEGFADFFAFADDIPLGESRAVFSVTYDWLGVGDPAAQTQAFEVFDFFFNVVDSGQTKASQVAVTEPAALLSLGLLSVVLLRRRRR